MRKFKVVFNFILCFALLGGIGYAIYYAIVNQDCDVVVSIDGEMLDISEIVSDYERMAEGEIVLLPSNDKELEACGITKTGYTFEYWAYDANGKNKVSENDNKEYYITKKQGSIALYLQWRKKDYEVYTIILNSENAEDFNFEGFNNVDHYNYISDLCTKNLISYEGYCDLQISNDAQKGYEYTWIKWTGEGECEVDENGETNYYSGKVQITDKTVFVRCKMPKKYTITYKYVDEKGTEQTACSQRLVFDDGKIVPASTTMLEQLTREGYNLTGYYFKAQNKDNKLINGESKVDLDLINYTGDKSELTCYVAYTPKIYNITIQGCEIKDGEIEEIAEIRYPELVNPGESDGKIAYYTNLKTYLQSAYTSREDIFQPNFVIFKKFIYEDKKEVGVQDYMPAKDITIYVVYEIKVYNVSISVKIRDEEKIITQKEYRYGTALDDNDKQELANAQAYFLETNQNLRNSADTIKYSTELCDASEFTFDEFEVTSGGYNQTFNKYQYNDLIAIEPLNTIVTETSICINTSKYRFFVEFWNVPCLGEKNFSEIPEDQKVLYKRNEITAQDVDGYAVYALPTTYPYYKNEEENEENDAYTCGGWMLADSDKYGEYAYIDYGYKIAYNTISDDIVAYAEWYENAIKKYISYTDDESNEVVLTFYSGSENFIYIPEKFITEGGVTKTIVGIGNGTKAIVSEASTIKKFLLSKNVKEINSMAFGATDACVRFVNDENGEPLTIHSGAFAPSNTNTSKNSPRFVSLPKRTATIEDEAFRYNSLSTIYIAGDENSKYYIDYPNKNIASATDKFQGGVLYEKTDATTRTLLTYCQGNTITEYEIPANVVKIGGYAFCTKTGNAYLKHLSIPSNNKLTTISNYAFAYLTNLSTVKFKNLPKLKTLKDCIFYESCRNNNTSHLSYIQFDFRGSTAIPNNMFYNTSGLDGIDLYNIGNINSIGTYAFFSCANNSNIDKFNVGYTTGASADFKSLYTSTDETKKISNGGYGGNLTLTEITQTDFQKLVKDCLQSFNVYNTLTNIEDGAFYNSKLNIFTNVSCLANLNGSLATLAFKGNGNLKFDFLHNSYKVKNSSNNLIDGIDKNINTIEFRNVSEFGTYSLQSCVFENVNLKFTDCSLGTSYGIIGAAFKNLEFKSTNGESYIWLIDYSSLYSGSTTIGGRVFYDTKIQSTGSGSVTLEINKTANKSISIASCAFLSINVTNLELYNVTQISDSAFYEIQTGEQNKDKSTINAGEAAVIYSLKIINSPNLALTLSANKTTSWCDTFYFIKNIKQITFTDCYTTLNSENAYNNITNWLANSAFLGFKNRWLPVLNDDNEIIGNAGGSFIPSIDETNHEIILLKPLESAS